MLKVTITRNGQVGSRNLTEHELTEFILNLSLKQYGNTVKATARSIEAQREILDGKPMTLNGILIEAVPVEG